MLKNIIIYIAVFLVFVVFPKPCQGEPQIRATSAAIGEVKSGMLIYEKNAEERRPPASLTKMMTAIIAVEFGDLNQNVIASSKAEWTPPSKLHLHKGEIIQLNSLLKSALMISANDACVAIAEHVGGEEEYFVNLMNLKAWAIGMEKTHFVNTNGLPAGEHYSCAKDLVRLGIYFKRAPYVNQITAQKSSGISRLGRTQTLTNTNKLLWQYPGTNGIKTGTTNLAGQCLASSATEGDKTFVAVVLKAGNRYVDSKELLNYAFKNYTPQKIFTEQQLNAESFRKKQQDITLTTAQDYYYPYTESDAIKVYLLPGTNKTPKKGEKCGVLALVTADRVLWYDIFAKEVSYKESFYSKIQDYITNKVSLYR